mmetsp:Transcript_46963/g.135798  ORF Transcript_46963/g.135798 Transcript_46963/m.135798 type:complete len:224 (+) Transcript_46963:540-1211(+)
MELPTGRCKLVRESHVVSGHLHRFPLRDRRPPGEPDDPGAHRPDHGHQWLHEAGVLRSRCWQRPVLALRHTGRLRAHRTVIAECRERRPKPRFRPCHGYYPGPKRVFAGPHNGPNPRGGARGPHHAHRAEHLCLELLHADPPDQLDRRHRRGSRDSHHRLAGPLHRRDLRRHPLRPGLRLDLCHGGPRGGPGGQGQAPGAHLRLARPALLRIGHELQERLQLC